MCGLDPHATMVSCNSTKSLGRVPRLDAPSDASNSAKLMSICEVLVLFHITRAVSLRWRKLTALVANRVLALSLSAVLSLRWVACQCLMTQSLPMKVHPSNQKFILGLGLD